jgi:hypothetical protein
MPSFLDFVFPFGNQVYPQDLHFSGLREESRMRSDIGSPALGGLGRSGSGIRVCYNLRSVEPTTDDSLLPWSVRQTAVCHHFDTETAKTFWVVIKGNKLIKDRLIETTKEKRNSQPLSRKESFSAALKSHLIMCDWSGENWRWYINDLENQFNSLTKGVFATQLEKGPSPPSPASPQMSSMSPRSRTFSFSLPSRSTTVCNSPENTTSSYCSKTMPITSNSWRSSTSPTAGVDGCTSATRTNTTGTITSEASQRSTRQIAKDILSGIRPWRSPKSHSIPEAALIDSFGTQQTLDEKWGPQEVPPEIMEQSGDGPQERMSFNNLQRIQHIEEKAQETQLILGLNVMVLSDLRQHYKTVVDDKDFPADLRRDCQSDLCRFDRCVLSVKKDLQMLQSRTQNLLDRIANRKNLVGMFPCKLAHWLTIVLAQRHPSAAKC